MKTSLLRKALYLADLILIVVLFTVVAPLFSAQSASGLPTPVDDPSAADGSSGSSDAITDSEVAAISTSGVIVPKPSSGALVALQPTAQVVQDASAGFDYILVATAIHSSGPTFAFFEGPGGVQSVKGTNDLIGGAKIVMILDGSVILEKSGQRFTISRQKSRGSVASAPVFGSRPPARPSVAPQPEEPPAEEETDDEALDEEWEDPDQMVVSEDEYREYLQNFGRYAGEITTQTHYDEEGNADGILLARVPTSSLAYTRGLREGDIVMSVQDTDITDDVGVALRAAWKVLEDEDYLIDLIIMRNGEEEVLTYEIWPE